MDPPLGDTVDRQDRHPLDLRISALLCVRGGGRGMGGSAAGTYSLIRCHPSARMHVQTCDSHGFGAFSDPKLVCFSVKVPPPPFVIATPLSKPQRA